MRAGFVDSYYRPVKKAFLPFFRDLAADIRQSLLG
jgi:hypothetical protein